MGNRRRFPLLVILGLIGFTVISASPSTGRNTDFDPLRRLQVDENEADNEEVDVEIPSERSNIQDPYGFEEEDAIRRSQSKTEPFSFKSCAVAADHYTCSTAGKTMFKKGGSAVDAAIAAQLCIEVVNPHSTGIGGGGFMLIYEKKSGRTSSIDFRESLPLEYTDSDSETQGKTVLTPGVLKGLQLAHKKYGKLKWNVLFEPAIDLCERGFKIHAALANAIKKKKAFIMAPKNDGLRELFAPNGKILKAGEVLKRPKLAQTFKRLSVGSADLFYKGDMAQEVVKDIREAGGVLSLTDLSGYRAIERGPLRTKLKGLEMLSTPPPGSGALISLALKILEDCKMEKEDIDNVEKLPETYHKIIEAMKFAYAPFTFLGDPRFTKYTDEVIKYMLDDKVAKNMFKRIDKVSHTVEYYGPYSSEKKPQQQGTSHISVLDPNGNAVSLTTTINAYFGSKLRSKRLGIIYNNELADFSEFWPSVYNLTKDVKIPGKRPMSKSSPIIFLDKKKNVKGIFGAAGGFFIPSCLTMTIANWLFFNDNIKMAVSRPRLHCQLFPPTVVYEPHLQAEVVPKLQSYSHAYVTNSTYDVSGQMNAILGVVQAIVITDNGKIAAECDVRKGGLPDGY